MVKTEIMRYEAKADKKFDLDKFSEDMTKFNGTENMDRSVYVGSGGVVYALYKYF